MATRFQVLIPITIAAVIVGVAGILSLPSDVKLESVEFPRGTVKLDNVVLEVQIADTDPRKTSWRCQLIDVALRYLGMR